jgi:prepilin-type processing-associated H-X9-DG protein
LLLPALARARESATQIRCAANLRQWAHAAMLYANQENGWLPRRGQGVQTTTVIDRPSDWFNALPPMLRSKSFVELVADGKMPRPGDSSIWICPSAVDAGQQYFFAYAMNMRLSTWNAPTPDKINRLGSWSTSVFMSEGPGTHCSILPSNQIYSPVARHRGRINISFLDGHVASYSGQEVGCGTGDPQRIDVRWLVPGSVWTGPPS